jgi:cell division initiation protein
VFAKGDVAVPLTVKDILEKTFKRSFKGYDEDEVDRFLDQVIDEFKLLQGEGESLKAALDAANERLSRISETETTIMNTLVSAQKSSERMLAEAARKAELIIDSAQTTARRQSEQTMADLAQAEKRMEEVKAQTEQRLAEIKAHAAQFAESFAHMINSQAASFEHAYRSYFGDSEPKGGIAAEATRRIGEDVEDGLKEIGVTGNELEQAALEEPLPDEPYELLPETLPEEPYEPLPETLPEEPYEPLPETLPEPGPADVPEIAPGEVPSAPLADLPEPGRDMMSLQEINKALSELEDQDGNILGDDEAAGKPRYDDYSWLYDSDGTGGEEPEIAGKDDETLKSLIDEVIE